MIYRPTTPPTDPKALPTYLQSEFQRIAVVMASNVDSVSLEPQYRAPVKPRDGLVVMADGSSWNPGSGAGVYVYRGAAWHFLG
jgi:hypothetical protein